MKAITTKFIGPTNTRGSRVKACDMDGNCAVVPYEYASNPEEAHQAAAEALKRKMNWTGKLTGGAIKSGYAFVFVDAVCRGRR